ncbi:MAG: DUF881 domain-containing protein [Firmicutes bacterium]|nr:DUF881 domain-containing protein [Bacillota bacterium]
MGSLKRWQLPVFVVFLFLGFLLSVQFQTQQNFLSDLSLQKTDVLVLMLKKLHDKRGELEKELRELDRQQQTFQADVSSREALTEGLKKESARLRNALGLDPVKGPGITITITTDSPIVYLDLVDIVNELWASQAEAIAINNQRITPWTSIFWNKEDLTLTINGKEVLFPCTIKAIGDQEKLESGLRLLGGVLDDLAIYKVYPVIRRVEEIELPAAPPPTLHYLRPRSQT